MSRFGSSSGAESVAESGAESVTDSGAGSPDRRVLGAFPSFASQGEDVISSTSFQNSLGIYGMAVLKYGMVIIHLLFLTQRR
jgi:hypothetical protein